MHGFWIVLYVKRDRFQKIYLSALTTLGHSLATRNSLRSLSRAASLNQHSSHFGELSASMILHHLSVADIKSSSPYLNTLHIQILLKCYFLPFITMTHYVAGSHTTNKKSLCIRWKRLAIQVLVIAHQLAIRCY